MLENCDRLWTLLIYHVFFFFGTCCWTLTNNMGGGGGGGGGGWWLVTSYVSFFPFLSPVNSFLHLFATFCSDFATFWTLLIYHAFYFFRTCCWSPTDNMGGWGSAVFNQCCAIKTKACLFFASRGPAIRWAWTFYFFLIDAGDNS